MIGLTSSLFSSLYNHLTGGDKVYEMMDSLLPVAKSIWHRLPSFCGLPVETPGAVQETRRKKSWSKT